MAFNRKSIYRVVPYHDPKLGQCWIVKSNENIIDMFLNKTQAEKKKLTLESMEFESFTYIDDINNTFEIDL
jgi:hypothetical protein